MLQIVPQMRILLACQALDFRLGIDRLAALCRSQLGQDPFSGAIFLFRNRSGTALRVLIYDGVGFWCVTRRFSAGRLRWWPKEPTDVVCSLTAQQLHVLLYNGDPSRVDFAAPWRPLADPGLRPPLPDPPQPPRLRSRTSTAATPQARPAPRSGPDPPPSDTRSD